MSEERTSPSQQDLIQEADNTSQAATRTTAKAAAKPSSDSTGSNTGDVVFEIVDPDEEPPQTSPVGFSLNGEPTVRGPPHPKVNGGPPPEVVTTAADATTY